MRTIKFLRSASPYTVGEVATFQDNVAERLVELGSAEYIDGGDKSSKKKRSLGKNRMVTTDDE